MSTALDGASQDYATHSSTPAAPHRFEVGGLAVTRRRRADVDPRRPAIVLVHGAMDRQASFGRVMRRLSEFDVTSYDRRGYANSLESGPGGNVAQQVSDLRAVVDWTGAESVVVVGHSFGGTLAMGLATGDIDGLVAIGVFEGPAPWLDGSFDSVGAAAVAAGESDGPAKAAELFYTSMVGDATWERLRQREREARRSEGQTLLNELRSLRDPDQAFDLSSVEIPALVGSGDNSSESMRKMAALVADALPDAWSLAMAGAGHGAHLTHPDEFASYVRACVARGEAALERRHQ